MQWSHPYALMTQRKARNSPNRGLWVPWSVSLWQKRASVAFSNQSERSIWINLDQWEVSTLPKESSGCPGCQLVYWASPRLSSQIQNPDRSYLCIPLSLSFCLHLRIWGLSTQSSSGAPWRESRPPESLLERRKTPPGNLRYPNKTDKKLFTISRSWISSSS